MRFRVLAGVCALGLTAGLIATSPLRAVGVSGKGNQSKSAFILVGPITTTNVNDIYDCGAIGGSCDMSGPKNGVLKYSQDTDASLILAITVQFATPSSTYTVYLTCGPSHDLACGFVTVGSFATDGNGAGGTTITVPVATLQGSPFGPGYRTDHVDMGGTSGDFTVAGAINYFIPSPARGLIEGSHKGDPTQR